MRQPNHTSLFLAAAVVLIGQRAEAQTNFTAGNVSGQLTFNGAAVDANSNTSQLIFYIPNLTDTVNNPTGGYQIDNLAPGTYSLQLFTNAYLSQAASEITSQSVTIAAETTTTANFELASVAGEVSGSITVNGSPLSQPSISATSFNGSPYSDQQWTTGSDGSFNHFFPPGSYTANVGSAGGVLGSFSFVITAGQVTNLNTVAFETGNVAGQITFLGAPVDANSNTSQLVFYIPNLTDTVNNPRGGYEIDNLAPGTYSLQLFTNAYLSQAASEITSQQVTIQPEQTTPANFALDGVAGEVSGSITVNGAILSQPNIAATMFNGASYSDQQWTTGSDGSFNHFFRPGNYTASVGSSGGVLGTFSFTVTAGAVTNLGTVAFGTGNVAGQVTFLGAPVDANSNTSQLVFYIPNLTDTVNNPRGGYEIDNLAPGTYSLQLFTNAYLSQAASEITSQQVTIAPEQTTTANFELSSTAGEVIGSITVNGQPLSQPDIQVIKFNGNPYSDQQWTTGADGSFRHFFIPGVYTASVSSSGGVLGTFTFTITAGQVASADQGTVPVGSEVVIVGGGGDASVGGITLTFTTVSASGSYTIIADATGPTPPLGFQVVGPKYYDVSTSAAYSGPIQVCVHYDPSLLLGPAAALQLTDASNSFADLPQQSVDSVNDIVCANAGAISTYALLQPIPPIITPGIAMLWPQQKQVFTASSGSGAGYQWSSTGSGSIDANGNYTAGAVGNSSATITLTDSVGHSSTAAVTIGAGVTVGPPDIVLAAGKKQVFTAQGGLGPYQWSLGAGASGSIDGSGNYTAGTISANDTVIATDSLGNVGSVLVSVLVPILVSPNPGTPAPRQVLPFSVSGGSGQGFVWSLTGPGTLSAAGVYTAPTTGSVTANVTATDSLGNSGSAEISVGPGVSIAAPSASVPPRGQLQLTASGGSNTGFKWSLGAGATGSISATGLYSAGAAGSSDTVNVVDSLGNTASLGIAITAALSLTPASISLPPLGAQQFSAFGGSGTGVVWSLAAPAHGSITPGGLYTAFTTGAVTDTVQAVDSLGNTATALVALTPGILLDETALTLPPRATHQFSASEGSGKGYSFALQAPANGTVDETGLYKAGTVGSRSDTLIVTDSLGNVATAAITIGPSPLIAPADASVPPRGTVQLTASGGSGEYVWALLPPAKGEISATGLYTAPTVGSVADTVELVDSLGNSGSSAVIVTANLAVVPGSAVVPPHGTLQFGISGGSGVGLVWSLAGGASGSISASGLYTAAASASSPDTVKVVDSVGNSATGSVTVGPQVSIAPADPSVAPSGKLQFIASGGSGIGYAWSLQAGASGTISAQGLYRAGPAAGSDSVKVVDSLGNAAQVTVTITASLAITPGAVTVAPHTTQQFTASGGSGSGYVWSLTGSGTISATGLYTAGSTSGAADTILLTDSSGNTASATATVGPGVSISPSNATLPPGGTQQFTASGGSGTGFTWSVIGAGSITAAGLYTAGASTAKDTVSVVDSAGNTAAVQVTVTTALAVSPGTANIAPDATQQFGASGGSGSGYVWSVSGDGAITQGGLFTAGGTSGLATVTVKDSAGSTATAAVTITPNGGVQGSANSSGGCATTTGSAAPQLLGLGLALFGFSLRRRRRQAA